MVDTVKKKKKTFEKLLNLQITLQNKWQITEKIENADTFLLTREEMAIVFASSVTLYITRVADKKL